MIRFASVVFLGLTCIFLGMMPTLAAGVLTIQKVSGDEQRVIASNSQLPVAFPQALEAQIAVPHGYFGGMVPSSSLNWSIDPSNDSAKCKIAKLLQGTFESPSVAFITASAFGVCVVNVIGPNGLHESFGLMVAQFVATPTPTPPQYVAKIMLGNNQTVVWPANTNQNGDNAYFTAMEVQLVDRAGNPAPNVEVDWECTMPSPMHCQMQLPMIMGILGKMGEMTHTDGSGKADLPAFVLAPNGAQSPMITNNGRGPVTVTADSPRGLFAPVVFTMSVK
jgi:hypothetical protein